MDEFLKKRIEKKEKELIKQRKIEEKILMNRMNRQLELTKMYNQRDKSLLGEEVEELENTEEEVYKIEIEKDGDVEVTKK